MEHQPTEYFAIKPMSPIAAFGRNSSFTLDEPPDIMVGGDISPVYPFSGESSMLVSLE